TRQEALVPVRGRMVRPVQQPAERPHLFRAAGPDRRQLPAPGMARWAGLAGQAEADTPDARPGQVTGRPGQPFPVFLTRQREPEQEGAVGGPVELGIGVVAVAAIAAD